MKIGFEEGRNLGSHEVLVTAASRAGLNASDVTAYLASNEDRDHVLSTALQWQSKGVNGVPFFTFNDR